ncbi:hypothetical protein [Egbenema bharatensis]|uniref:hypothetical protein n=1 Tax=Egbenema bharatensis TaxID=3463334 RepID=UPI003A8A82CE
MKTLVSTLTVLPSLLLSYPVYGRLAISLLAGILMGFTVAPVKAWPLAWFALIPLWLLLSLNPPVPNLPISLRIASQENSPSPSSTPSPGALAITGLPSPG